MIKEITIYTLGIIFIITSLLLLYWIAGQSACSMLYCEETFVESLKGIYNFWTSLRLW